MQAMRIAFLEDDPDQADRIVSLLQGAGHVPHLFPRGRALLTNLQSDNYDLIMLDWEVPDLSGYEVLQALRGRLNVRTPVLFLTHRDNETDVVQALEAGADDFLIKPPRERELLARMEALGRRVREPAPVATVLNVPPYRIDRQAPDPPRQRADRADPPRVRSGGGPVPTCRHRRLAWIHSRFRVGAG